MARSGVVTTNIYGGRMPDLSASENVVVLADGSHWELNELYPDDGYATGWVNFPSGSLKYWLDIATPGNATLDDETLTAALAAWNAGEVLELENTSGDFTLIVGTDTLTEAVIDDAVTRPRRTKGTPPDDDPAPIDTQPRSSSAHLPECVETGLRYTIYTADGPVCRVCDALRARDERTLALAALRVAAVTNLTRETAVNAVLNPT